MVAVKEIPEESRCPANVLEAIYGEAADKRAAYERSLNRWWKEYSDRKNDEEDEHVADSLLYDRSHLPRAAPPPDSVFLERERSRQNAAGVNVEFADRQPKEN